MPMDMAEEMPEVPDDFAAAIQEAFPAEQWDEDRLAAMKEAIRICVQKDLGGGYDDKEEPKKGEGLALIFGPKPKKE